MLKKDFEDLNENGEIGDWYFFESGEVEYIGLAYPAPSVIEGESLKDIVTLPIYTGERETRPSWQWDGNIEAPTLSPSINVVGKWHGYLEQGKLRTV